MRDREIANLTHMLNESRKTIYYKDKEIESLQLNYYKYPRSILSYDKFPSRLAHDTNKGIRADLRLPRI